MILLVAFSTHDCIVVLTIGEGIVEILYLRIMLWKSLKEICWNVVVWRASGTKSELFCSQSFTIASSDVACDRGRQIT